MMATFFVFMFMSNVGAMERWSNGFFNAPFLQPSIFPIKKPRRIEPAGLGNFQRN
jgi:hypothetical protein